ncbi:MAG TPA: hypothetical protein DGG95_07860 [Cytophagales bacterium]|jgi:uncharacterized membrane protein|nr:hypothetical protein [Cytophagales bacterium]
MDFHPLPQPEEIPEREKEDAMGAYLMMFAAVAVGLPLPVINLIASVIYYFINKKKSRFIHFHSLQALLSNIPTTLINWGAVIWAVTIFFKEDWHVTEEFWAYVIFAGVSTFLYFIVSLIAAFKARQGKMYYFLLFGKIAYEAAYKVKTEDHQNAEPINKPPF